MGTVTPATRKKKNKELWCSSHSASCLGSNAPYLQHIPLAPDSSRQRTWTPRLPSVQTSTPSPTPSPPTDLADQRKSQDWCGAIGQQSFVDGLPSLHPRRAYPINVLKLGSKSKQCMKSFWLAVQPILPELQQARKHFRVMLFFVQLMRTYALRSKSFSVPFLTDGSRRQIGIFVLRSSCLPVVVIRALVKSSTHLYAMYRCRRFYLENLFWLPST